MRRQDRRRNEALAMVVAGSTRLGVAVAVLATHACAPHRDSSILPYRDRPGMTAYRVVYTEMWDPAPVLRLRVVASREGPYARLDATVNESPMDPQAAHHFTRRLSAGDWHEIAECWESYSLFWEMGQRDNFPQREFFRSFTVEGVRGGDYRVYTGDNRGDAETRQRDCARKMIVASGLRTNRRWWWSEPDEGGCAGARHPPAPDGTSVDQVLEPDYSRGACPEGMSEGTTGTRLMDGGRSLSTGHTFCLDYAPTEITCADWNQADQYCRARGKRLPTQEEWDWAVEGSPEEPFPWGLRLPGPNRERGGRFRQDVDGGISFVGYGYWEWTSSSGGNNAAVLEGARVFHEFTPTTTERDLAIDTASRDRSYRAPFLTFRCAR